MKTNLIRVFAIMTLATSISAFALAETNPDKNGNCSATSETKAASANSDAKSSEQGQGPQDDQEKARQQLIEKQNKQWLHDLQGIYG